MPIDGADIVRRYEQLKSARTQRDQVLQVAAPYVDPSRGEAQATEVTEGQPWMTEVYDSQGIFAADLSAHYIQGQSATPGRKSFGLRERQEALNEIDEVREWLEESRDRMLLVMDRSAFYPNEFQVVKDWYSWGAASAMVEEMPHDELRPVNGYRGLNFSFDRVGRFVADFDALGKPLCHGVERMWSAAAAVERFGIDNVSDKIKAAFNNNKLQEQFKFIHFISKRKQSEMGKRPKDRLPYQWSWVECDSKHVAETGGYHKMRAIVPRQNGLFGEPYGRGRADIALNDLITLNTGKRMSFEDWALKIRPMTFVRSQVLFGKQNLIPGSFNQANWNQNRPLSDAFFFYDGGGRPEISQINQDQLKSAIDNAFFVEHLRQSVSAQGTHEQTATERMQIERQILRLISSFYIGYINQFWEVFVDLLFDDMFRAGAFSQPPDILLNEGGQIDVVFDSPLANSQALDEVQAMTEWEGSLMVHGQAYLQATGQPSPALDLYDPSDWYRELAFKLKVPSGPIRSQREVALIRESRAEQQRQQQMTQELAQGAESLGKVAPFVESMKPDAA